MAATAEAGHHVVAHIGQLHIQAVVEPQGQQVGPPQDGAVAGCDGKRLRRKLGLVRRWDGSKTGVVLRHLADLQRGHRPGRSGQNGNGAKRVYPTSKGHPGLDPG